MNFNKINKKFDMNKTREVKIISNFFLSFIVICIKIFQRERERSNF